ncbi:MAG: ABC transporter ATP-binding protein [Nocardioides sp.]|uniref:ABC transporter ATP-binding protein n=1 Tax=Nocardioides sp. TaxID=35761 RepID=UPI0039E60706
MSHRAAQESGAVVEESPSTALRIDRLSMSVRREGEDRPLLAEVSLQVSAGETVGLVGESGSGKSLTSRAALGLFPRRARIGGQVRVRDQEVIGASRREIVRVRRQLAAMVFQDPRASVNPVCRIGDFVTEGVRASGRSRAQSAARAIELLAEVGIRDPERALRAYPHEFSGGMLQRVMIAAALMGDPALLLADEATTALDVTTQAEVMGLLRRMQRSHGAGTLLVTHDLDLAAATCDRIYVMYAGRIVESATSSDLFASPRHPYTRALLSSSPSVRGPKRELRPIAGRPLALVDAPPGCAFRDRCPDAIDRCGDSVPRLREVGASRTACVRAGGEETA